MRERVCKNCGGKRYSEVGQNRYKCLFCGTIYVDEYSSGEEEILIVGAYEKLREYKFESAEKEFSKIISLYPKAYEAYYGRLQARNRVVYFVSKEGGKRYPSFFGSSIPSYFEDEDYKKAIEYAPKEIAKSYEAQAEYVESVRKEFLKNNLPPYEVVFNANAKSKNYDKVKEALGQFKTFCREEAKKSEGNLEARLFQAISTCKCEVFLVEDEKDLASPKLKNLYDRFIYRIETKERFPSSFIVVYDEKKVKLESIKKLFPFLQVLISVNDISFILDLINQITKAIERNYNETVTLSKRTVEQAEPTKVEPTPVIAKELGHYNVENIPLSDKNKTKWIFYSLKNGDFATAEKLIDEEKSENRGEIYFASLLCQEKIKTPEEFFSSLDNFKNKELLEDILKYSDKEFANNFLNRWEELVVKEDDADTYVTYLPFLLPYDNSWRSEFLKNAEEKAIASQNKALIECVEKALSGDEIVNFYFQLAQESGNEEYYNKILKINNGHAPSLYALFMHHFSTVTDKLTFREDEAIKNVLQFCSLEQKEGFLNNLINLILDVCYYDLDSAEKQLDYYLSYYDNPQPSLIKIAKFLKEHGFFRLAEKYISIAIGNDKKNASLYWELIEIKAHARSEAELLTTNVKISEMDDWSSVLSYASEEEAEHYAQIVANANTNNAKKIFRDEVLDKIKLKKKLQEFISRNDKILSEVEDKTTAGYYHEQIHAFENYFEKIDSANNLEEYLNVVDRVQERLSAMGLTLDSSISLADIATKKERYATIVKEAKSREDKYLTDEEVARRKKKRDLTLFACLCYAPMLLVTLLLIFVLIFPKGMYLGLSQDAVIVLTLLSVLLGIGAFIYNLAKKNTTEFYRISRLVLFALGIVNLFLMLIGFYISPPNLEANSAREFSKLAHNAKYANILVMDDFDMANYSWTPFTFYGEIDGNGHRIYNLSSNALFQNLDGKVSNLNVEFIDYIGTEFYGMAKVLNGEIENCSVKANIQLQGEGTSSGLVGDMRGGEIFHSTAELVVNIRGKVTLGGLVGNMREDAILRETYASLSGTVLGEGNIGGLVGENNGGVIEESFSYTNLDATIDNSNIGGLVGLNRGDIVNSYAQGALLVNGGINDVGGLVGEFFRRNRVIEKSYSNVNINAEFGAIVGRYEEGKIQNSFAFSESELYLSKNINDLLAQNPVNSRVISSVSEFTNTFGLDEETWIISNGNAPTLVWFERSGNI